MSDIGCLQRVCNGLKTRCKPLQALVWDLDAACNRPSLQLLGRQEPGGSPAPANWSRGSYPGGTGNYDRPSGGYAGGGYGGNPTFGRGYGPDYGRDEGRGFFERAGDAVASWFGDDDAARRRERDRQDQDGWRGESHKGRGPSDYTRSDERIREDANDRLTDDHRVDARKITVTVDKGDVILAGTVTSREDKRRAEDVVDRISGVRHVQNNLRIADRDNDRTETSGWGSGSASKATTATGAAAAVPKTSG